MPDSLRIAVVHNLPSGGALRVTATQVAALRQGHHVEVWTLSTAERELMGESLAALPVRVHDFSPSRPLPWTLGILDPVRRRWDLGRLARAYRSMAQDIDREGFDVVLAHPCQHTQAPLALLTLKTPVVYVCHEPPRVLHEPGVILGRGLSPPARSLRELRNLPLAWWLDSTLRELDRRAVRRATRVICQSRFMVETIQRTYGTWASALRWGIDTDLFSPAPEDGEPDVPVGPLEPGRYFLSAGAMTWAKGFWFLVEALGLLPMEWRWPLVLISDRGSDDERSILTARARELGVTLVTRTRIPDRELARLYRQAALTLYAPILEPLGLVPLESQASGTPVVGVQEGGVRETVRDGVTGLLTDRDPREFASAIRTLLEEPVRRQRMGRDGRRWIQEEWTWTRSNARLEQMLREAAAQPAGGREGG